MSLISIVQSSIDEEANIPIAATNASPQFAVLGSVISLTGSGSSDPLDAELTYLWSFSEVPIGSAVKTEGFKNISDDGSTVSFSPDLVGKYSIGLTVNNGTFSSKQVFVSVDVRAILLPDGRGIVPDGKFIWSYLRDVWTQVENKEWVETFWSSLIQLVGADTIKLYQNDFSKSIKDIQDNYLRRWLPYEPKLALDTDNASITFGYTCAGSSATTSDLGVVGEALIVSPTELVVVRGSVNQLYVGRTLTITYDSEDPNNLTSFKIVGINVARNSYKIVSVGGLPSIVEDKIVTNGIVTFSFQSKVWTLATTGLIHDYALAMSEAPGPIDFLTRMIFGENTIADTSILRVGDFVEYATGPNKGFYEIMLLDGPNITVREKPASYSTLATSVTHKVNIYRPIGFSIDYEQGVTTNTFLVDNEDGAANLPLVARERIMVVGGQAYVLVRNNLDIHAQVAGVLNTISGEILTGQSDLYWRVPHMVSSTTQNFESLGISTGDLFNVDLLNTDSGIVVTVPCQVVGCVGNKFGFVITNEEVTPGAVPPIPNSTYLNVASVFGITGVVEDSSHTLIITGQAAALIGEIESPKFIQTYGNRALSPTDNLVVSGATFNLRAATVVRNSRIPVDTTLLSVPVLQNYLKPPSIVDKGGSLFLVKDSKEYPVTHPSYSLIENSDYVVDGHEAFFGYLTIDTDTKVFYAENANLVTRNMRNGDAIEIVSPPALAGTYTIGSILSDDAATVDIRIPTFTLGLPTEVRCKFLRKTAGSFIRFIPNGFTAKTPAPDRFWAELSIFDNSAAIEGNFGVLVGLKKEDLDVIDSTLSYRQAVAGLMYAYTRGTALDSIRIGVQILLGLPFAESRGTIKSIDRNYRLNAAGEVSHGRIVIEDLSDTGSLLGTQRLYIYPINESSSLLGIAINPTTGVEYTVGDSVELFAPLSKGVEVNDYLSSTTEDTFSQRLQRYHAIKVIAEASIFTDGELALVSRFLKEITPSRLGTYISSAFETSDTIPILDSDDFKHIITLYDNASFSISPTMMRDEGVAGGADIRYIRHGPVVYQLRCFGKDITRGSSDTDLSSPTSTFLTDPYQVGSPVRVGDVVFVLDGPNMGEYPIDVLTSTTEVAIDIGDVPEAFVASPARFWIGRPTSDTILTTTVSAASASTTITASTTGLQLEGVSPGDMLCYLNTAGTAYVASRIVRVGGLTDTYSPTLTNVQFTILDATTGILTASSAFIIREAFIKPVVDTAFTITTVSPTVVNLGLSKYAPLVRVGDELVNTDGINRYLVIGLSPLKTSPPIPTPTVDVYLARRGATGVGSVSLNPMGVDPQESVELTLYAGTLGRAYFTIGSPNIALEINPGMMAYVLNSTNPPYADTYLHIKPGDRLELLDSSESGKYHILEVTPGYLIVNKTFTTASNSRWKLYRSL
jgi:hypothetical protein